MTRRQRTGEYKIKPIKKKVREILDYPYPTRVPKGVFVEQWVGISSRIVSGLRSCGAEVSEHAAQVVESLMPGSGHTRSTPFASVRDLCWLSVCQDNRQMMK